jgi:AraC-like DNA-binding protein
MTARMTSNPVAWPLPPKTETAAFQHLRQRTAPIEPHAHEACQLLWVVRGEALLRAGEASFEIAPPGGLLVWDGVAHALECPKGPAEMFTVQLDPAALAAAAEWANVRLERPRAGVTPIARLGPLLNELVHELVAHADALAAKVAPPPLARLTYPYLCLALVDRLARKTEPADEVLERTRFGSEHVERAVLWMRAHLPEPFRLGELARRVGTSPRHLAREFGRELGMPPVKYLARLRIAEASRRLLEGDRPVKEIAIDVGYSSVPRFNTAFREQKQMTPLEWRARRGR